MTVREIEKALADAGIEEARTEARLIAEHVSGKSAASLLADPTFDISGERLGEIVARRCERYPLQYLLGEWEFCGLPFKVTPDCLIPRPDSEIIAEKAASLLKKGGAILDLCAGTGCILAAALKLSGNTRGTAVDLFPAVCEIAKANLARLGLECTVITGDATTDLFAEDVKFDVITANPPYVTADEMRSLEPELAYEPETALTDGGDGLAIIRKIIEIYKNHLTHDGTLLIEHGASQASAVAAIAEENGLTHECLRDYGGHDRVTVMKKAKTHKGARQ